MPRGGHRVKPVKAAQVDASTPLRSRGVPSTLTKPSRTNTDLMAGILLPKLLSRNASEKKLASLTSEQPTLIRASTCPNVGISESQTGLSDLRLINTQPLKDVECAERDDESRKSLQEEQERPAGEITSRASSTQGPGEQETYGAVLDNVEDLTVQETYSSASSLYSRDSASLYSRDSASIYSSATSIHSSASSIYSSGASIYSFDECGSEEVDRYIRKGSTTLIVEEEEETTLEFGAPTGLHYQQRARSVALRRREAQDAASRERSTLAKKAAMFKNSRLPLQLSPFGTSLATWSMVCRAAQASHDCYGPPSRVRRGIYTPADSAKDIKAMIVDDEHIDDSRIIIVSIRGTQCQSLTDWAVNKAANPAKPIGFLDDEENACHAGFLQVTKAMVGQVAAQLQQHPASSERPSLLFTGHSAGGAVAAMLYSHMLSTSVHSDLTALASLFPSINCVTFGAPPLSQTPLPRRNLGSGVFLAFANEGDPVVRLSNAAYVKSLAKLMTASPPPSITNASAAPPVKVIRRSRGSAVIRQTVSTTRLTSWEELPVWPTPPVPFSNAGDIIILRDKDNGNAAALKVTAEDLSEVIFADLAQHTTEMYIQRINEVALAALIGRDAK